MKVEFNIKSEIIIKIPIKTSEEIRTVDEIISNGCEGRLCRKCAIKKICTTHFVEMLRSVNVHREYSPHLLDGM